mmetsp:Transcript_18907/g.21758  ORF Transcript_18907/g.21758 Transcript_18907/m.21758 type:complete len:83 (-) Transcript_18907:386-634(-)
MCRCDERKYVSMHLSFALLELISLEFSLSLANPSLFCNLKRTEIIKDLLSVPKKVFKVETLLYDTQNVRTTFAICFSDKRQF